VPRQEKRISRTGQIQVILTTSSDALSWPSLTELQELEVMEEISKQDLKSPETRQQELTVMVVRVLG